MNDSEPMTVDEFVDYVDTLDERGMDHLLAYAFGFSPAAMTQAIRLHRRVAVERAAKAAPVFEPSCNERYATFAGGLLRCTLAEGHEGLHAEITTSGIRLGEWPAVITDSERTCNEVNPDGSGEHCYRGGDHAVHCDSNGDEWRTDLARVSA